MNEVLKMLEEKSERHRAELERDAILYRALMKGLRPAAEAYREALKNGTRDDVAVAAGEALSWVLAHLKNNGGQ